VIGHGASASNSIADFCHGQHCTIPFVIGGPVNFTLIGATKVLFSRTYALPPLNFSCTSGDWETRMCRAKNVCYNSGMFAMTAPYGIDFDSNLLVLGSRPPPVDFTDMRLINRMRSHLELPVGIPFLTGVSHLFTIFYHMEQQWHLLYDFIVPAAATLMENGRLSRRDRIVFLGSVCEIVPHLISALSKQKWDCLFLPVCFEEMRFGMEKVMNKTVNPDDPPYQFPATPLEDLRNAVYDFFELSPTFEPARGIRVAVIARLEDRKILNLDEVAQAMEEMIPGAKAEVWGFELFSLKEQIVYVRPADVLVGMHGSGLAMQLFMKPGTKVVEVLPYRFNCRDWYERAANFSGLRYIAYRPESESEAVVTMDDALRRCFDGLLECSSPLCLDRLRDQDLRVDIAAFKRQIAPFLA
jgi:hypothetical protein